MVDETGWMPDVARVPTNSWGYSGFPEEGMYPQAVVSHVAQGYFSGLLGIARASEPGKSWHFSVGRNGEIAQHVSIWNPAYHAGVVNDPQPLASALIGQFGSNPNTWSVGIEMEGFSVPPGYNYDYVYDAPHPWPEAQIASVIEVHEWVWGACQWLLDLSPTERENRLLTHSMIDQRTRRQDPGDLWISTVRPRLVPVITGSTTAPKTYLDGVRDGRNEMLSVVQETVDAIRRTV